MQQPFERNVQNVIIVDDDRIIRQRIHQQLRAILPCNYTIFEAHDGVQAFEIISTNPIAIVLTDMRMPRMDGLKLVKAVRQNWPEVQLAILSRAC